MSELQLSMLIDRSERKNALKEVEYLYALHYPRDRFDIVLEHHRQVESLFDGSFPGYRRCNTEYHDFNHTADTFLAVMRLVDGYNLGQEPLPCETATRLLSAALFHDTGYIQKEWDTLGTGAKYTREHITRSKEFVSENSGVLSLAPEAVEEINLYIDSTGFNPVFNLDDNAAWEKTARVILGAADLIAQMADRLYLEKLLFLYYEFREAGIEGYETEFDIIRKTVDFYETVCKRLEKDYLGVNHFAFDHFRTRYGIKTDLYREAIENNIIYVKKILEDSSTNFRAKLHRIPT